MIRADNLVKTYKISLQQDGILGTLKSLYARKYKVITALNNISFQIQKGEAVGFVGPNGAGKSTTIKILTGILKPESGTAKVLGLNPLKERTTLARSIGVLFGHRTQLWPDLPLIASYRLLKAIYGISNQTYKKNLDYLSEMFSIQTLLDQPVRKLSQGQRLRADLIAALLHDPQILFLDEPTLGLDLLAKERFLELLRTVNHSMGVTILLTSHDMDDIVKVCSRIIMVNEGLKIVDDTLENIQRKYNLEKEIHVLMQQPIQKKDFERIPLDVIHFNDRTLILRFPTEKLTFQNIMELLSPIGNIQDIHIREKNIEDIIKIIYREHL